MRASWRCFAIPGFQPGGSAQNPAKAFPGPCRYMKRVVKPSIAIWRKRIPARLPGAGGGGARGFCRAGASSRRARWVLVVFGLVLSASATPRGYLPREGPAPLRWHSPRPLHWAALAVLPALNPRPAAVPAPTNAPATPAPMENPAGNAPAPEVEKAPEAMDALISELMSRILALPVGTNAPASASLPLDFVPPQPPSSRAVYSTETP